MEALLNYANFAWFRLALASETDETKRRDLEEKLAKAEAEFEATVLDHHPMPERRARPR